MENNQNQNTPVPHKVKTLESDIISVASSGKGSMVKEIIDTEERKEIEKTNLSPSSTKNQTFLILGILFLLLSLGGLFLLYNSLTKKSSDDNPINNRNIMIFSDQSFSVAIDGLYPNQAVAKIYNETQKINLENGRFSNLYFTENKNAINFSRFISFFEFDVDNSKVSLIDQNFMTGLWREADQNHLFFLFKVSGFNNVFPFFTFWEDKMFQNLYGFFGIENTEKNKSLQNQDFTDAIVQNKNARVLYDEVGEIVLMYVFIDDNYVVITDEENVVKEIITRMTGSTLRR